MRGRRRGCGTRRRAAGHQLIAPRSDNSRSSRSMDLSPTPWTSEFLHPLPPICPRHVRHGRRRRRGHPRRPRLHSRLQERPRRALPADRLRPALHRCGHRRLRKGHHHPPGSRRVGESLPPACPRRRPAGQAPRPRILPWWCLLPRLGVRRRRARPRQPARRAGRRDRRVGGVPPRAGAPRPRALRGRLGGAPVGGRARGRPGRGALADQPRGLRARPRRRRERRRQHRAPRRNACWRRGAGPRRGGELARADPSLLLRGRQLRVGRDGHGVARRAGAALAGGLPGDQWVRRPVDQPDGGESAQPGCKRALVCVGGKDAMRGRGRLYPEKLIGSGWQGEVEIWEADGQGHGFHLFRPTCAQAEAQVGVVAEFLGRR
ncbi:unnamed protein product [Triticum turgidum subsp. durum]|uniref:Alpha/beta hydrolase fold-3 domain-containing protein n=1 Tax=Triticum turgidum subsp. durum TaxID=4567 RepID=A0A9R0WPQ3_TRITD|nr:unnamed protein product [Triticum turgidum subsp. durum]